MELEQHILPDPDGFEKDPFGYSSLAWHKWGMAQMLAGYSVDITKPPTTEDLKSPVLWLSQAHALSEAALVVIKSTPNLDHLPIHVKGACDCQYCAVGLMLVGYSLEVCLKAMLIMKKGIKGYIEEEKKHKHHDLEKLSELIPDLSAKDKAILRVLSHFVLWAGRYPDPGSGREGKAEEVFTISEKYKISAKELFQLSARIMGYTHRVIDSM